MSALQVMVPPWKRAPCASLAAATLARIASEGSPRRSSVSLSFGSQSRLHPGHLDVDVAYGFATGWRSITEPEPALLALSGVEGSQARGTMAKG